MNERQAVAEKLLGKITNALDRAINNLSICAVDGTSSELVLLIERALKRDTVYALKNLSYILPKQDLSVVVQSASADHMTDAELASIIATRARARFEASNKTKVAVAENISELI